jgi:hypothetical protein
MDFNYPVSFDHVISVAAVTKKDQYKIFHNNKVDAASNQEWHSIYPLRRIFLIMARYGCSTCHGSDCQKCVGVRSSSEQVQVESCLLTTTPSAFRRSKQLHWYRKYADAYGCL